MPDHFRGNEIGVAKMNAPQKFTAFEAVGHAAARTTDLAARVSRLADRLCGSIPPRDARDNKAAGIVGIFGALHGNAEDINRACSDMEDALRRIEAALPGTGSVSASDVAYSALYGHQTAS